MKKFVFIFIFIFISSIGIYKYIAFNNNVYNVSLPSNYDNFEKEMFHILIELNDEEKSLLMNYALRFKQKPSQITVKEALNLERSFENTNEGTVFFSKLKDMEEKANLLEMVSNSAFVTFVDFEVVNNSINIIFAIKNKSPVSINYISGDFYFIIAGEKFISNLEFTSSIPESQISQIVKSFNFSEFPALKDISKNSEFKMNVKQINFSNGNSLSLK